MGERQTVFDYHERTKHHLDRYARSLGYLDWRTQPDPFRRYEGADLIHLKLPDDDGGPGYDGLFDGTLGGVRQGAEAVSELLYDSLSLSAWKSAGKDRWALRVNPSSGNLHPTEAYLLCGGLPGLSGGPAVYHYAPREHGLERRAPLDRKTWNDLSSCLPPDAWLVGLTSIVWREAWKYGERAFRYCQHDIGHALGTLSVAAAMQGRVCRVLEGVTDDALARVLGIARQTGPEREHPDVLVAVVPAGAWGDWERSFSLSSSVVQAIEASVWSGTPSRLSPSHHPWPVLDDVAEATRKDVAVPLSGRASAAFSCQGLAARPGLARALVRQRRSAVAMDGRTEMDRETFYRLLSRLVPPSFVLDALPGPAELHLMLLVHRVRGLPSGLYALVRNPEHQPLLRAGLDPAFVWQEPEACPPRLCLRMLMPADVRDLSRTLSCHQDIASDGAFAVAMVARFRPAIEEHGAWFYRRLFWEAGLIGQLLYLEAEAAGLRGTGIGCYFDDAVHQVLGIEDDRWQSLYHFTVGGAVEDSRLGTDRAYAQRGR